MVHAFFRCVWLSNTSPSFLKISNLSLMVTAHILLPPNSFIVSSKKILNWATCCARCTFPFCCAALCWAAQFYREFKEDFKFDITRIIGLTNGDEVSKEYRPFKQMIARLNRTYKALYRPTNGFDNVDGANYDLALWVAYYNFLRPHKHNKYKVLNDVEMLHGASNMPGKWQLLIFLGQQTILNLQNGEAANCS